MTPHQVFTVAALGGALGVLTIAAIAALSAAAGILGNKAFERATEWRQQRHDRRQQEHDRRALQQAVRAAEDTRRAFDAITALPTHDPRNPR
ncbi:hypothetical protein C6376_39185 [Streptomyces sp. P3]|uniref:hypothetical protein n=1 Tax=Streptomyces sp. P3 TaxID=2135430 RepID=UPI000D1BE954|nr:hypothetical protein [Streptomyces sp. P3]AVV46440.1 hypothetical protein C6376_38885 [Streptomyces sp. P3]AVV46499.1 hypothetical protein C6376_39185 [Streptomyces sp. P3]